MPRVTWCLISKWIGTRYSGCRAPLGSQPQPHTSSSSPIRARPNVGFQNKTGKGIPSLALYPDPSPRGAQDPAAPRDQSLGWSRKLRLPRTPQYCGHA